MYCELARRYGWTFGQIRKMTPQQQQAACGESGGGDLMSFASGDEYRRWKAAQSAQQAK